jgi:hypothetical protein
MARYSLARSHFPLPPFFLAGPAQLEANCCCRALPSLSQRLTARAHMSVPPSSPNRLPRSLVRSSRNLRAARAHDLRAWERPSARALSSKGSQTPFTAPSIAPPRSIFHLIEPQSASTQVTGVPSVASASPSTPSRPRLRFAAQ